MRLAAHQKGGELAVCPPAGGIPMSDGDQLTALRARQSFKPEPST